MESVHRVAAYRLRLSSMKEPNFTRRRFAGGGFGMQGQGLLEAGGSS